MFPVPLPRPFVAVTAPAQHPSARLPLVRTTLTGFVREEALRALGPIDSPRITRRHRASIDVLPGDEPETSGGEVRPEVRPEALPETLPETLALTSWRGLSGRRYVVSQWPWPETEDPSAHREMPEANPVSDDRPIAGLSVETALAAVPTGALLLAVRRRPCGKARLLGAMAHEADEIRAIEPWHAAMTALGAEELHVHLLAGHVAARRAACADLPAEAAGDADGSAMPTRLA